MNTDNNPIISFCIPVYNRGRISQQLVNGILRSPENCFELVVSDNASTDDTQQLLSAIKDPRLKYYRFEAGVPVLENWENTFIHAKGEYIYLVMNRDEILGENIPNLVKILKYCRENNITYMLDRKPQKGKPKIKIYDGIEAMIYLLGPWHDTGNVFSGKLYRQNHNAHKYFQICNAYIENFLKHDMLLVGRGARIASGVNSGNSLIKDEAKEKAGTPDFGADLSELFNSPKRRTILFFEMLDMVNEDYPEHFSYSQVNKFFRVKFSVVLSDVSYAWRVMSSWPTLQAHYGHTARHVTFRECYGNMIEAYHKTKAHLKEKGHYSFSRQLIMYYCVVKAFILLPVKLTVRKILSPTKIWTAWGKARKQ